MEDIGFGNLFVSCVYFIQLHLKFFLMSQQLLSEFQVFRFLLGIFCISLLQDPLVLLLELRHLLYSFILTVYSLSHLLLS
jgi:hypothetical protein